MSSKYLMSDILHTTSRVALIKSLQDRPDRTQGTGPSDMTLRDVQIGLIISDSRLDDELSVATIEFHHTPKWLSDENSVFPMLTTLGTLWQAVDLRAVDKHGQTEFIRAVIKGGSDIEFLYVEMLAEFADTDINALDDLGRTALHWACELSRTDMVRLCLSVPNCNSGLLHHDGLTAFDISLQMSTGDDTISNLFYHTILDLQTYAPQEALLRLLTITSEPATATNSDKPVFPGKVMFDPVLDANEPLVAALIARGIECTAKDDDGNTALHMAVGETCDLGIARKLIDAGWDVNAVGKGGATPLHCATRTRDVKMVELLLEHEADVAFKDDCGHTALNLVEDTQCQDLVVLLQAATDATTSVTDMPTAITGSETGRVQTPPAQVVDDTFCRVDDIPSLSIVSAVIDDLVPVRGLFTKPEDVDIQGRTALHCAAKFGDTETVSALVTGGASIDALNNG